MFMFNKELTQALLLLISAIVLNIISGGLEANLKNQFDKDIMKLGTQKGLILIILTFGISLMFNFDNTIAINGTSVVEYLIIGYQLVYVKYVIDIVRKIFGVLNLKIEEVEPHEFD